MATPSTQNRSSVPFVRGQCWSSEAEPELGLGFVLDSDFQTVTLQFPLVGEQRRYGKRSAPLKRMEFREGDTVQPRQGDALKVLRIENRAGINYYVGAAGEVCETELSPKIRIHRPLQRFLAGHWDPLESYLLRQRTLILASRQAASPGRGMIGPRAQLLPHQLYVVDQVARRALPRALLADEVGLGKTIEAGWIMNRLLVTGRARRVLVIVPPALVNQWFVELLRRFSLSFWVPSSQSEEAMTVEDFKDQERLIMGSDQLEDPTVAEGLQALSWDLVIVDEAHRISGSPTLQALAAASPGLLLLTATPEQLGLEGHFERLQLIDPARFSSWEQFKKEHSHYREVMAEAEALLKKKGRQAALDLVDRQGTGRVYYRNSRRVIDQENCAFPERLLCEHKLTKSLNFKAWLMEFAQAHRDEKTLLICASPEAAMSLEKSLREEGGLKAVAFHEKMPLLARDRNAAYFEDPDGASILISSELGGEGRNFQHATHLILADLPLDPDVLEQRIGRLDRIGGPEKIQIHVPFSAGSAEEKLLRWHSEAFGAFEAPAPAASPVHSRYSVELAAILEEGTAKEFEALLKKAKKDYAVAAKEAEAGRDRLIELHSFDPEAAGKLVESLVGAEKPEVLRNYLDVVFDSLNLHVDDLDADTLFVEAGDSAFASYVPGLPPEGIRFTYSRERAIKREDTALVTWDHPLVTGLMESIASQEFGNTSVAAWTSELGKLPLAIEAHFVFETTCDPKWNLSEFFAPLPIRMVVDGPGNDLSTEYTFMALQEAIGPLPPNMEAMAKRIPGGGLRNLLFQARDRAELAGKAPREAAQASLHAAIEAELTRLKALAAKSGSTDEREVKWWNDRRTALTQSLKDARVRLDSILIILPRGLAGGGGRQG